MGGVYIYISPGCQLRGIFRGSILIVKQYAIYLKSIRIAKGLSGTRIGEMTNGYLSASAISMFENGHREPNFLMLQKISEVYEVPMVEIFIGCGFFTKEDVLSAFFTKKKASPQKKSIK